LANPEVFVGTFPTCLIYEYGIGHVENVPNGKPSGDADLSYHESPAFVHPLIASDEERRCSHRRSLTLERHNLHLAKFDGMALGLQ
jgi:hypothetical protein